MKKILITGTAGFIGFHVAKKLLSENYVVVGIDNFSEYYDIGLKERRNEILKRNENFIFYKEDIAEHEKVNEIVQKERPDAIIHIAAQAGVRYSLENPWVYERANILGTLSILEAARKNNIKRVVFSSSSSVYGDSKKISFSEDDRTDTPISLYAATKKSGEVIAHSYNSVYGIEIACLRFFTVYGPWGRPDMAVFKFVKNILQDKPIDVYNRGKMSRDFTFVDDIADGVLAALKKPDLNYEVFNLGGDNPVKLMNMIKILEKHLGRNAQLNLLPIQQGDVLKTYADISKAKKELGYHPKVGIEEGLKRFVDWFLENKDWLL